MSYTYYGVEPYTGNIICHSGIDGMKWGYSHGKLVDRNKISRISKKEYEPNNFLPNVLERLQRSTKVNKEKKDYLKKRYDITGENYVRSDPRALDYDAFFDYNLNGNRYSDPLAPNQVRNLRKTKNSSEYNKQLKNNTNQMMKARYLNNKYGGK